MAWLCWLGGGEWFALQRDEVAVFDHTMGPQHGLPCGIGHGAVRLQPETKFSPHQTADVVAACTCHSGLSLGKWLDCLLSFQSCNGESLFSTPKCHKWDSGHFHTRFAWPILGILCPQDHPLLAAFTDSHGGWLQDTICSMHSWCRGGESFTRRHRPRLNLWAATFHRRDT